MTKSHCGKRKLINYSFASSFFFRLHLLRLTWFVYFYSFFIYFVRKIYTNIISKNFISFYLPFFLSLISSNNNNDDDMEKVLKDLKIPKLLLLTPCLALILFFALN